MNGAVPGRCIAMWSGPRNLSTAMMRAFENRSDTHVVDEPFYAHYLAHTGADHPMRDAVIAAGDTDWRRVSQQLSTPPARGIFYQKHITTHWQPHFTRDWLDDLSHAFLIRAPEAVVRSYDVKRKGGTPLDLGYPQQAALYDSVASRSDRAPPVIDCDRFLADPHAQLQALCERLAIEFEPAMLSWPPGRRDSDGVWADHWYDAVERSTGFAPPSTKATAGALDARSRHVADTCRPYYEALRAHAL